MNPSPSVMTQPSGRQLRQLSNEYVIPETPLQRRLAALWSTVLNVEPVGLHDDFFELGGHSLLAAELLDALSRDLGAVVSARVLYLQPTVAELAEAIDAAEKPTTAGAEAS
jgi:acyl carrier protein